MAIRDTTVKYFDSSMNGAPTLSGTIGNMVSLFDQCLNTGFGAFTVTSLSVTDGIATMTADAGHNLTNPGSNASPSPVDVGVVILVAGVNSPQGGLNREWRATVTDANTLTWECGVAIPNGTAAGTITCKRAPAGWESPISTLDNKATYRSLDPASTGYILRLNDAAAQIAYIRGYETMSDIDTGTEPCPTVAQETNGIALVKSSSADATVRRWAISADAYSVNLAISPGADQNFYIAQFGDVVSLKQGDVWNWFITGGGSSSSSSTDTNQFGVKAFTTTSTYIARAYTQSGASLAIAKSFLNFYSLSTAIYGASGITHPNPIDGKTWVEPVWLVEVTGLVRGLVTGLWTPLHVQPISLSTTEFHTIVSRQMRAFNICPGNGTSWGTNGGAGQAYFDMLGPWRP
jgi:hypothetical protein